MSIRSLKLSNVLSYGPQSQELALAPLNVLIGPNGSGKSNLIEVMGLLQAVPGDLGSVIVEGGGIEEWLWAGRPKASSGAVEVVLEGAEDRPALRYALTLRAKAQGAFRVDELVEGVADRAGEWPPFLESNDHGEEVRLFTPLKKGVTVSTKMVRADPRKSVLSQFKHPDYVELERLSRTLARIALFRELPFGRKHVVRMPQKPDLPNTFLLEDAANLGLVLNQFMREYEARDRLMDALRRLYDGVTDYHVDIQYGTVQLFLRENDRPVPATRLSDGTLRYLCLLSILCHPTPPPLVCIEEPEIGLHPDVLPGLVELLREASERCQLIVTTHSDVIVDALTDAPESVVICEKQEASTTLRRLDAAELMQWLEDYRLGELWSTGQLGGNRW